MPRGKLSVRVAHKPPNPTTAQKITFIAKAHGDVAKVEILVNARLVKTCPGPECEYVGGPYPERTVTYGANAYDKAGNRAWTGYQSLAVKAARAARPAPAPESARRPRPARPSRPAPAPEPARSSESEGRSTILGRLTGGIDEVKHVIATNLDRRGLIFKAPVGATGIFKLINLPDGRYRVTPSTGTSVEVISEPRFHEVRCQGDQSYTADFDIEGIDIT